MIIDLLMKGRSLKKFKTIISILLVIGLLCILLGVLFIEEESAKGLLSGIGFGLVVTAALNLIIVQLKAKKDSYEEEMELQFQDERVKLNKMKALAYTGIVTIFMLCTVLILNVLIDFDLLLGNIIVLFTYSIVLVIFKYYYKNK